MSDQNQILRLLATLREEVGEVRQRQEELFELLVSYKDQIQDLKATVVEKLAGLPRSPYIAGQLVPMPKKLDGVEDYRELLATYLHKAATTGVEDEDARPVDTVYEPPPPIPVDQIELEDEEDGSEERPRRRQRRSGGGGGPRDSDLERGPDRDVEPFDLSEDEDEDDDEDEEEDEKGAGGAESAERRRRRRRRRRGGRGRGKGDKAETSGGEAAS